MGIRKKISIAFLCLALMLAFSGLTSMFELNRMSGTTEQSLNISSQSMSLTKQMLDAAQEQNTSLLEMVVLERTGYAPEFIHADEQFRKALSEARLIETLQSGLDSIEAAHNYYGQVVASLFDPTTNTDIEWFLEMYSSSYKQLTNYIKNNMTDAQQDMSATAAHLKNTAYRALTPGIITLGVAILMILIFAFMLDLYYTRPIIGITKSLKGFVDHKLPFNVKMEGRDEIFELKEYIGELIGMYRNKKREL